MLLVGSRALNHWYPGLRPDPRDTDYIATIEEYESFVRTHRNNIRAAYPQDGRHMVVKFKPEQAFNIVEFEIAWEGSTAEEILALHADQSGTNGYFGEVKVALPSVLLMMKLSHRYLKDSPHFLKTMQDIRTLRRLTALVPELEAILKRREAETYVYKHPNLDQSKMNFFDASVKYVYDHDDIHKAVAVGAVPAYTKYSVDGAEVRCSRKKFMKLTHLERLYGGLEESYVLAIERSLIPFPGVLTPHQAFLKALMKVCTSITSGWFREFVWEHYDEVAALYDESFWEKFQKANAAGKVKAAA